MDYYIGLCLLLERPAPSVALVASVAAVAATQALQCPTALHLVLT